MAEGWGRGEKKLLFVDARKAYFNAEVDRPTYVTLPSEVGQAWKCGRLSRCMYGTRAAGMRWEETYTQALVRHGFLQGKASPCCFRHPSRDLKLVVHGDDFTILGTDEHLDWFEKTIQGEVEVKIRGRLGGGEKDDREIRVLNRIVRWTQAGIRIEADPRHVEVLLNQMRLADANKAASPGVRGNGGA